MSFINKYTFLAQQVDSFYAYMASVYQEYYQLKDKPIISNQQENNINIESRIQTFAEYFLYKLYYNYGVKRRNVAPNIALLFYAKGLKGYKADDPITMLCRHMMLDISNMRIISLGVPKAMKLEHFCKNLEINVEDATTNTISNGNIKFMIYRFPEGTMMTYNPGLAKYNITETDLVNNQEVDNETELSSDGIKEAQLHSAEIEATIQKEFAKQIPKQMQYSTRKVSGTGRFSSLKTFMEMFNENNTLAGVNLELIPANIMQDKVLVFNIEHVENRVISSTVRNYNTLCAVYQFKSEAECTHIYSELNTMELIQGNEINLEQCLKISKIFNELGKNMVISHDLIEFSKILAEYKVYLFTPDSIRNFTNSKETDNISDKTNIINYWELNMNQINDIVQHRPKDFQGYIIYGHDGSRSKIVNTKYKELKNLKGHKPIVIEQWNTKNLFYLYWRLVKLQLIPQFIAEFDTTGGWSYNQLFYWFASLARGYAINLFRVYHNSFVKKSIDKYNIPYSMKPMCGDLHNMYKTNKIPISQSMVEQYLFSQSAGKMFWRLFSGK